MQCFKPLKAWRSKEVNSSGKRSLVFSPGRALQPDDPVEISCGQCIGCRLKRSRQWAIRCLHESQLYENNCFITLTYNDESLMARENPWSLDVNEFQRFMKRLRKQFVPVNPFPGNTSQGKEWNQKHGIRFFHCGEYGEKNQRPHYHACLFNFDFPDRIFWSEREGIRLYRSPILERLWPYGFATIGEVTFESAAYVARYIMKKVTGEKAEDHYIWADENGEVHPLKPEYITMSRRPGIGARWFEKYKGDVYPKDFVTVRGKKMQPPKYYDKLLEKIDGIQLDQVQFDRLQRSLEHLQDSTPERLAQREYCKKVQIEKLVRNL